MKTVQPNCRVTLRFEDEEASYTVKKPSVNGIDLSAISTASPLGKAIVGKNEGEEIILNINGNRVWCLIVKISDPSYSAS